MGIEFVNIHGLPLVVVPQPHKANSRPSATEYHKGWVVVGFSPTHLAEGRRAHEALQAELPEGRERIPFNEASFMRTNRPRNVRSKPYEIYSSAEVCAEMARRSGWKLVQAQAKAKG